MEQVIVDSSYGNCVVYRATLENAKKILECHTNGIDPKAMEIYNENKKVLNKDDIVSVINNILSKDEGSLASKSIHVNKENKQEVVMYCFNHKIGIKNNRINDYDFFNIFKLSDFSFFANNIHYDQQLEIVDSYLIEQVRKYNIITNDKWKEGAKEIAKIRYVLEFAQQLAHRDVKYELSELKNDF